MREDWVEVVLGEVCKINMGQSPPSSTYNTDKIGLPFFQGKAEFTELHPIVEKWCSEPTKIAEPNDILLSVRAPVGATNVANQKCAIGRGLAAISYTYDYKYILFFLRLIEKKLDSQGTGTTFRAISGTVLKSQIIPLAPLPIQRAIVQKIENLFASLDKGIADLKTAQEQLKVYRQAVLKKAFEGGFTATADGKDAQSCVSTEKNNNLPEGWKWVKLGEVATKIGSGSTPQGGQENYKNKGIPLIRSMNIHFDYIKYDGLAYLDEQQAKKLDNVTVFEDDILLNITGASIGRVNVAPKQWNNARVNQHVSIIRLNKETYNSKFIKYYIQAPIIQEWIANENYGATRQALSKSMIENILIPNITLAEQHAIVREIESRLSVCDKVEQEIALAIERSRNLRQSILKKAFEGRLLSEAEVTKCKQEADYEPASVLLERIERSRNERIKKEKHGK